MGSFMTGKFRIGTVTAVKCGTVISVPKDSDMDFALGEMNLTDCNIGFEERDYSSLAQSVGLPPDTPPELIIELVHDLRNPTGVAEDVTETVKRSRLWEYVQRAGDVASVIEKLTVLAGPVADAFR